MLSMAKPKRNESPYGYELTCDLPFPLHVGSRTYHVAFDGGRFPLKFKLIRRRSFDKRLEIAKTTMDIARDRHGFISYSRVKITIPATAVFKFKVTPPGKYNMNEFMESSTREATELARHVLNRFIEWYRQERREFWIEPLQHDEMFRQQIEWIDSTETKNFAKSYAFPGGGIGPRRLLSTAQNDELSRRVRADKEVPTHRVLFLDAQNALDRGEADLAIFQAFLSVEAAIRQIVRTLVVARAIPFSQASRLVTINRRQARTFDDALEIYGNVDHMLTDGLTGLGLNAPDTETPQWQDWQRCRRLRNLISHQGFTPSENDARRCLAAAEWLLRDFLNPHFDSLPQSSARDESNNALRSILAKPSKRFLPMLTRFFRGDRGDWHFVPSPLTPMSGRGEAQSAGRRQVSASACGSTRRSLSMLSSLTSRGF
jgi:hypothetical protein